MDNAIKINEINKSFYIRVADHFNITRQYSWRGWEKLFKYFEKTSFYPESFLDLGCGNGRFIESIKTNTSVNFKYLGIDSNKYLIKQANTKYKNENISFIQGDILENPPIPSAKQYDLITLFGVMHHIPSQEMRIEILKNLQPYLSVNGKIAFTVWNFKKLKLFEKRLKKTEIEVLGINIKKLEKQDYFLRWSDSLEAVRFCHNHTKSEVKKTARSAGYKIDISFDADGADGKTNTYYVLNNLLFSNKSFDSTHSHSVICAI